jgi:class 3 adenylate cyclase/pimeloyl-ACP methyl ester carboxylesterase
VRRIGYARNGETSIAYQVSGEGPFDLVLVPGFISHLEFDWEEARHAAFLDRLASFSRLIRLDKRGTGLSDREGGVADLETRIGDVRAVMDAVGSERAALFAYMEGGPMAVLFAATYPARTRALVLAATYANGWGKDLSDEQLAAVVDEVGSHWGDGSTIYRFAPDADEALTVWWGTRERLGGSPGAIRQLAAFGARTAVADVLDAVQAPALVLHRSADPMLDVEEARRLADGIAGARLMEVKGNTTLPWLDCDQLLDEVEEFLTGTRPVASSERVLTTILFTDLVASTEAVQRVGDQTWARLLEQHHSRVRGQLGRFGGIEIDTAGDGFFATFDGPARAIRCALAIRHSLGQLGLKVRAGIHTGEVEKLPSAPPRGIAVHVAARIAALAQAGDILVSATTRDLVAGSGLRLTDRGEFDLKGIEERRRVFAASD